MSNQPTINKLHEMHLSAMATSFRNQLEDPCFKDMGFEDRFSCIVEAEWLRRRNNRINRLIKNANLKYNNANMESIEYHDDRKLNKESLIELSTCNYLEQYRNIIIIGATGSGKSWLSCALGFAACRRTYSVKYVRLPELLDELKEARARDAYRRVIHHYVQPKLLIIDEWLLIPLKEIEARDLLEVIESRSQVSSTIFCSQYMPEGWHQKIGQATLADAILDRIMHNSYKILIEGKVSMRERKGLKNNP